MRVRTGAAAVALLLTVAPGVLLAGPTSASVRPCSAGLVALTFDDGPATGATPDLLRILEDRRLPATFFMVGERVDAAPGLARKVSRAGFAIGNHTYRHEDLPLLGNAAIRATLRHTRRSIVGSGAHLTRLTRPPYGAIDDRVRSVIEAMGLTPVLWTDDSRDWAGGSTTDIARTVLSELHPHETNIVLQHDGVANSPASVAAVPRIVATARSRGYCFARLGADGTPVPPVPVATVSDARVTESDGHAVDLQFRIRLDRPTSVPTSVLVATGDGSATSADYRSRRYRLSFPSGVTRATVSVPVVGDRLDEPTEDLHLVLSRPHGLTLGDRSAVGRILDNDAPPTVSLGDVTVAEPATGSVDALVPVTLGRASGRTVTVHVATVPGTATEDDYTAVDTTVTFAPGSRSTTVPVPVLAGTADEGDEQLTLVVRGTTHATVADGSATVTITPPPAS